MASVVPLGVRRAVGYWLIIGGPRSSVRVSLGNLLLLTDGDTSLMELLPWNFLFPILKALSQIGFVLICILTALEKIIRTIAPVLDNEDN